jgi:hypothetical protein
MRHDLADDERDAVACIYGNPQHNGLRLLSTRAGAPDAQTSALSEIFVGFLPAVSDDAAKEIRRAIKRWRLHLWSGRASPTSRKRSIRSGGAESVTTPTSATAL